MLRFRSTAFAGVEAYRRQANSLQAGDQESFQGEDQAGTGFEGFGGEALEVGPLSSKVHSCFGPHQPYLV